MRALLLYIILWILIGIFVFPHTQPIKNVYDGIIYIFVGFGVSWVADQIDDWWKNLSGKSR